MEEVLWVMEFVCWSPSLLLTPRLIASQISLEEVLEFFKSIGMSVGPTTKETLHALFGRKRESIMELHGEDDEDHSCLTSFGLKVPLPHVRIESLCLIMLAAVPLMSGNKKIRDILPHLTR